MSLLNTNLIPSELEELYSFCNQRYFQNSLPLHVDLEWSPRMYKKLGLAISRSGMLDDNHTIRLSETLRGNKLKTLGILVHEMLHIKAYDLYEKTGKSSYLDLKARGSKYKEEFCKGHGVTFHTWKNKLNEEYPELNISAKDDSSYDDYEIDNAKYYGIYLQFTGSSDEVYHMIYHSKQDFRDNDQTELINGLKSIYGEENIIAAKTFQTERHDVKQCAALTSKGIIRKKSVMTAYKKEFISEIMLDERTVFDANMTISKSSEYAHIDEELRKTVNLYKKNKSFPFEYYVKSIIDNYARSTGDIKLTGVDKYTLANGHHNKISTNEITYLFEKWKEIAPIEFLETEAGRKFVSSVFYDVHKKLNPKEILKNILNDFSERGFFRFDSEELKSTLLPKVINYGNRKKFSTTKNDIETAFSLLDLSIKEASVEDCLDKQQCKVDLPYDEYLKLIVVTGLNFGHRDISSENMDKIERRYQSVSYKDIKNTSSQTRFDMLMMDYFDGNKEFPTEEIEEIKKRWEPRIGKELVTATLVENYINDFCQKENLNNEADINTRKNHLMSNLLNPSNDLSINLNV